MEEVVLRIEEEFGDGDEMIRISRVDNYPGFAVISVVGRIPDTFSISVNSSSSDVEGGLNVRDS